MVDLTKAETFSLDKMFCCVEARGKNTKGETVCVYFGIHLHNLQLLLVNIAQDKNFNPKDYNAGVLAWSVGGRPSEHISDFMRDKFSFHEDKIVLELAL
jgi:hypothetical protein